MDGKDGLVRCVMLRTAGGCILCPVHLLEVVDESSEHSHDSDPLMPASPGQLVPASSGPTFQSQPISPAPRTTRSGRTSVKTIIIILHPPSALCPGSDSTLHIYIFIYVIYLVICKVEVFMPLCTLHKHKAAKKHNKSSWQPANLHISFQ